MSSSRRALLALLGVALPFAAGAASVASWAGHFYASTLLALLAGGWIASSAVGHARHRAEPPPPPPPPGDDARERRRLAAYLNLTPAPLVALDGGGRLRAVNHAARALFATDDLVVDSDGALRVAIAGAAPGRSTSVALGRHSFALTIADLTLDPEPARIATLVDIDAELRAAEAGALRDLLGVLSHEVRNTLTPIASLGRTAADMLAEPVPDLPAIGDAIATMARRAESLQRFSESYAALVRLPPPTPAPIAVTALADDLARLFRIRWPDIALTLDLAEAPATLAADADQLSNALWALLQNAAEALAAIERPAIALSVTGGSFAVTDNGPGVGAGDLPSIFRPFFTTRRTGSGVGLALARQVFRGHGGDLAYVRDDGLTVFRGIIPR